MSLILFTNGRIPNPIRVALAAVLLGVGLTGHPVKVTPLGPVPGFDVPPALPVIEEPDPKPLPGGRSYVSREQFLAEQELEWKRVSTLKK